MSFETPLFGSGLVIEFEFRDGFSPDASTLDQWQTALQQQAREVFGSEFETSPDNLSVTVMLQTGSLRYCAWLSIPDIRYFRLIDKHGEEEFQLVSKRISSVWAIVRRKAIDFVGSRQSLKDLNTSEIRGTMDQLVCRFTQGKIDMPEFAVEVLDLSGQYEKWRQSDLDQSGRDRVREYLNLLAAEARAEMTVADKIREGATEMAVGVGDVFKQIWKNASDTLAKDLESKAESDEDDNEQRH